MSRRQVDRPQVTLAHLGLGNFFRAHQAWYTNRLPDAAQWGIAAFSGRSAELAERLSAQRGRYTLITRAADGNTYEQISSVTRALPAADLQSWLDVMAAPSTTALTLTITEAGYHRGADGDLDLGDAQVRTDIEALRADLGAPTTTAPARLMAALSARRRADSGPIALVPYDNLPDNGAVLGRIVRSTAVLLEADLAEWIDRSVSFVTTMVDRITPRSAAADSGEVLAATGRADRCPVVTEPFSEWVLSGAFPAGRPRWETVGVQFVDDVGPFEQRKLWLLNGAHCQLAYLGSIRGHVTVADAMTDDVCVAGVRQWWAEAAIHLEFSGSELAVYTDALIDRFTNPNIRHLLAQIAADGSQKLPARVLPVLAAEREAGRVPVAAISILAAWIAHLRGAGAPVVDVAAQQLVALAHGPLSSAVPRVLDQLGPAAGADVTLVQRVVDQVQELAGG